MGLATLLPESPEVRPPAERPPRAVVAVIIEWRGRSSYDDGAGSVSGCLGNRDVAPETPTSVLLAAQ
jgi:hypothetical protein